MRKPITCVVVFILLCVGFGACKNDSDSDILQYAYSIEERDSLPGGSRGDTFRIEKYKAPAGKKFKATCVFKTNNADQYPQSLVGEGEILYVFFQTHGRGNNVDKTTQFGFAEDMDIKSITYKNLYKTLELKDSCVRYFNSFKKLNDIFLDYEAVENPTFYHTVYTGNSSLSVPTTNGKGYVYFNMD